MTKLKVTNTVQTGEVLEMTFATKKDVAEFIKNSGITENSVSTIQGKIKDGVTLYDTYKIEELEEEMEMTTVNNEVQEKLEEVIELVEEVKEDVVVEETPTADETPADETPSEEIVEEKPVAADEKVEDAPTENKRRIGKRLIAYKNGEEFETFPSIKACASHFKELLNLGHMPFTPIMKSVRQDTDWNEYSFKFENEDDLHTPTSRKEAQVENASVPAEKKSDDDSAQQSDEVIEEITEEELV